MIRALIIIIIGAIFSAISAKGQDLIIKSDKDTIRCKIQFRDTNQLKYIITGENEEQTIDILEIESTQFNYGMVKSYGIITRKNGQRIKGAITSEREEEVYITYKSDNKKLSTYVLQSDIESIQYGMYKNEVKKTADKIIYGLGLGLDYGILGANITLYPVKNIGFFAGGGYVFNGMGYNLGIKLRLYNEYSLSKITPYIMGMYGITGSVVVAGESQFNKTFTDFSLGAGIDIQPNLKKQKYISISLIFPANHKEINDYIKQLENKGIEFYNIPLSFRVSIGYKF